MFTSNEIAECSQGKRVIAPLMAVHVIIKPGSAARLFRGHLVRARRVTFSPSNHLGYREHLPARVIPLWCLKHSSDSDIALLNVN